MKSILNVFKRSGAPVWIQPYAGHAPGCLAMSIDNPCDNVPTLEILIDRTHVRCCGRYECVQSAIKSARRYNKSKVKGIS